MIEVDRFIMLDVSSEDEVIDCVIWLKMLDDYIGQFYVCE